MMQVAKRLNLRKAINRSLSLFKLHLPYDEADHVLNIALNLLAGGNCLQHLEDRRCDEAYLDALGAQRIPDPTTAGDFCRRFADTDILQLMNGFNEVRQQVWQEQPDEFFECAIIEADGTQVETSGEKKQGIGINYKSQWGYHPLVVTLANTREPLFIANRSGNRPSHEHAAFYFDLAVSRCRKAGFRKIVLRGDTDFSLTENFDRWDDDEVEFVFGLDAMPNLVEIAETLDGSAWKTLDRRRTQEVPPAAQRAKRPRFKERIVERNGYLNKKLVSEQIAEFNYRPGKCSRSYRVVVLKKEVHQIPRRQLFLAGLAPRAAEGQHDPATAMALELERLAVLELGAVELGGPIALLDLGERTGGGQADERDGDDKAVHGYLVGRGRRARIQRRTASSSSMAAAKYLRSEGPGYLRPLRNKVGVPSTPTASPSCMSAFTRASAAAKSAAYLPMSRPICCA
jgi:hypothetical protein